MKAPVVIHANTLLSLIELNKSDIKISTALSSLEEHDQWITTMIDSSLDIKMSDGTELTFFIFAKVNLDDENGHLSCGALDHNVDTTGLGILNLNDISEIVVEFENEFYTLNEMCDNTTFKNEVIGSQMMNYDVAAVNNMLNSANVNYKPVAYA